VPEGTTFLRGAFENLYRAPWAPLSVGDEARTCEATVRVIAVEDGLPSQIEVIADRNLDEPAGGWVTWEGGKVHKLVFPAVGEVKRIPWSPGPSGLF
jgi:hypothetical protein